MWLRFDILNCIEKRLPLNRRKTTLCQLLYFFSWNCTWIECICFESVESAVVSLSIHFLFCFRNTQNIIINVMDCICNPNFSKVETISASDCYHKPFQSRNECTRKIKHGPTSAVSPCRKAKSILYMQLVRKSKMRYFISSNRLFLLFRTPLR